MLLGFLVSLGLLVPVFSEINQAAYGRGRVWGNLNQVHTVIACHGQGVAERQNTQLLAIDTNNPDFAGTDFPVYPDERNGRRRRT
jgi:hypothetical protein